MILKDAINILVENNDVERIRMFNEIVWEKNRPTKILLTTSTASTSFLNSYTLTATISEDNQEEKPVSGTISFYENIDNNSVLIGTSDTIIENNKSTAVLTLTSNQIATHTYYAVFEKTNKYKASQSANINVEVQKDTPTLTMLGKDTNIYNTWNIGAKLTNSKGSILKNKTVTYGTTSKSTGSSGKAIFNISGKTAGTTLSVKYNFAGDDYYNACSLTKKYKILDLKSEKSPIAGLKQSMKDANNNIQYGDSTNKCGAEYSQCSNANNTAPYQRWDVVNKDGESICGRQNCYCKVIGTSSGTWKRPAPITATFTKKSGTIKKVDFSYSDKKGKGFSNGGYPTIGGATVTLKIGSDTYSKTFENTTSSYKSHSHKWNCNSTMSSAPTVKIEYPANTGGEDGLIFIKNLKLTFYYIPTQTAL